MASSSVKSVLFLLIAASCVCSTLSFLGPVMKAIPKLVTKPLSVADNIGIQPLKPAGYAGKLARSSEIRKNGIDLAKRFFKAGEEKGFHTGYKWGTRYFKIDDTCRELTQCRNVSYQMNPQCVTKCIIEIGKNTIGNYCITYRGCYPQEATCSLDQPNLQDANCGPNK